MDRTPLRTKLRGRVNVKHQTCGCVAVQKFEVCLVFHSYSVGIEYCHRISANLREGITCCRGAAYVRAVDLSELDGSEIIIFKIIDGFSDGYLDVAEISRSSVCHKAQITSFIIVQRSGDYRNEGVANVYFDRSVIIYGDLQRNFAVDVCCCREGNRNVKRTSDVHFIESSHSFRLGIDMDRIPIDSELCRICGTEHKACKTCILSEVHLCLVGKCVDPRLKESEIVIKICSRNFIAVGRVARTRGSCGNIELTGSYFCRFGTGVLQGSVVEGCFGAEGQKSNVAACKVVNLLLGNHNVVGLTYKRSVCFHFYVEMNGGGILFLLGQISFSFCTRTVYIKESSVSCALVKVEAVPGSTGIVSVLDTEYQAYRNTFDDISVGLVHEGRACGQIYIRCSKSISDVLVISKIAVFHSFPSADGTLPTAKIGGEVVYGDLF